METDVFLYAGIPKGIKSLMTRGGARKRKKAVPRGKNAELDFYLMIS